MLVGSNVTTPSAATCLPSRNARFAIVSAWLLAGEKPLTPNGCSGNVLSWKVLLRMPLTDCSAPVMIDTHPGPLFAIAAGTARGRPRLP